MLDLAERTLGPTRTRLAIERIRSAPLSERYRQFGELTALCVGTQILGDGWWSRPLPIDMDDTPPTGPTGDQILAGEPYPTGYYRAKPIEYLGYEIAEATADRTDEFVDLNRPGHKDRVDLPEGATPGMRIPVAFDVGGRVDAVVKADDNGQLHTWLDEGSFRHSPPAETSWAVDLSLGRGRHYLPDEEPGTGTDPQT